MDNIESIFTVEIKNILNDFEKTLDKRQEYDIGFNIFNIVSNTYYYENFHSEIIAAILNPQCINGHGEDHKFLHLFLDYLNELRCNIDKTKYAKCEVKTEYAIEGRRIDILITSESHNRKNAIIIENKINDAKDMDNQIPSYYDGLIKKRYEVDAIIYLSLNGKKEPDKSTWKTQNKDDVLNKLKCISAYELPNSNIKDLYHGWLKKCISDNEDTRVIINQYSQLIKHLRKYIMEYQEINKLYELIISNPELGKNIFQLDKMIYNLPTFFANRIKEKFDSNPQPFDKILCDDNESLIFEHIEHNGSRYFLRGMLLINDDFEYKYRYNIGIADREGKWTLDESLKKKGFFDRYGFLEEVDWWESYMDVAKGNIMSKQDEDNIINKLRNILKDLDDTWKEQQVNLG